MENSMHQVDIAYVGGSNAMVPFMEKMAQQHPEKILVLTLGAGGSLAFHQTGNGHNRRFQLLKWSIPPAVGMRSRLRSPQPISKPGASRRRSMQVLSRGDRPPVTGVHNQSLYQADSRLKLTVQCFMIPEKMGNSVTG
jgi:hypothetical protein